MEGSVGSDYKGKIAQIAAAGNKPEDWKEYIDIVKSRAQLMEETRRNRIIAYMYCNAFKAIPESCKTLAHAQLLVDYAEFKSLQDLNEAEKLLSYGRRTLRHFAIIHIAGAELELMRGNKEKARRILQRAPSVGAEPLSLLKAAVERLNEGKTRLLSDSMPENNTDHNFSPSSGKESSDEVSSSQFSGTFGMSRESLRQALPGCKSNTQEVQQDLDILTQYHSQPTTAGSSSFSLSNLTSSERQHRPQAQNENHHQMSTSDNLKSPEPPVLLSRQFLDPLADKPKAASASLKAHLTSSHSYASIPETPQNQRSGYGHFEYSTAKKSLHSYHSTPDMRPSIDSAMKGSVSKYKPLNLGPPRRVKVDPAIRKLQEDDDEDHCTKDITVSAFELFQPPSKSVHHPDSEPVSFSHRPSDVADDIIMHPHHEACDARMTKPTDLLNPLATSGHQAMLPSSRCSTSSSSTVNEMQSKVHNTKREPLCSTHSSSAMNKAQSKLWDSKPEPLETEPLVQNVLAEHKDNHSHQYNEPVKKMQSRINDASDQRDEPVDLKNMQSSKHVETESFSKKPLSQLDTLNRMTSSEPEKSHSSSTLKYSEPLSNSKSSMPEFIDREVKAETTKEILAKQAQMIQQQQQIVQQLVQQQQQQHAGGGSATYSVHDQQAGVGNQITPAKPNVMSGQKTVYVNDKPYTVMKLVGRGGSAKVYQVYDAETNTILALKCVNLSCANEIILQGYMNEIGLLRKLQHCDRVIKLYDSQYIEVTKKLLVVLEFGETDLSKFISNHEKNQQSLHPITVCYFWFQMVSAVNAMHKEGVIHSDLKPANFILVSGQVKLIDFGIANSLQQDSTSVMKENMVGTPSYMSPEALMASNANPSDPKPRYKVGVRSDVWSLGCILYQMVYGHTPFQHVRQKLDAIVNPAHAISFPDKGDPVLMDVLKKCLTRDVKQRPTTDQLLAHPYLQKHESPAPTAAPSLASKLSLLETVLSGASPRTQKALSKRFKELQSGGE